MKFLFISNFYPPVRPGGYSQLCQDVTEGLRLHGHQVRILTSNFSASTSTKETDIYRVLPLDGDIYFYRPLDFFLHWKKRQARSEKITRAVIRDFEPDAVMVWGMQAISRRVLSEAERLRPSRVAYYLADYWPVSDDMHVAYWNGPARTTLRTSLKRILARYALRSIQSAKGPSPSFQNSVCVSSALRRLLRKRGLPLNSARVIYNGVDFSKFSGKLHDQPKSGSEIRLLYAGLLAAHKGVDTAIDALAALMESGNAAHISLTILGSGHPEYEQRLQAMVNQLELTRFVRFLPQIPREEVPELLRRFDILVFPSTYEEPLARIVQEGMASGLAVVGTMTGGMGELLVDGWNSLTFQPGNSSELADCIRTLIDNPELRSRFARNGRAMIQDRFDIKRTVQEVGDYLSELVHRSP